MEPPTIGELSFRHFQKKEGGGAGGSDFSPHKYGGVSKIGGVVFKKGEYHILVFTYFHNTN